MSIEAIVSEDVVTVQLEDTLLAVADRLGAENVGSAVVLDADGGVVGMVTDRDLVVYGQHFVDDLDDRTLRNLAAVIESESPPRPDTSTTDET